MLFFVHSKYNKKDVGVKRCHTNCSVLRTPTILKNKRYHLRKGTSYDNKYSKCTGESPEQTDKKMQKQDGSSNCMWWKDPDVPGDTERADRESVRFESFAKDPAHEGVFEGTDWEMLSDSVFAAVSDTKTPQGVLCLVKMKENRLEDMLEDTDGVWLVLENVQDPGNLERCSDKREGAGISGVIMDKCTRGYLQNPKTIRSTMGSIFRVPFILLRICMGRLVSCRKRASMSYAAHLEGSVCYDEPDYTGGSAFLIGNEGNGLTAETAKLADTYIQFRWVDSWSH